MASQHGNPFYVKAVKAANVLTQAEKEYDELIGQFVASSPVADFQALPQPKRFLNSEGM
jgi:hypothetical protein